jgi:hypothetical protein
MPESVADQLRDAVVLELNSPTVQALVAPLSFSAIGQSLPRIDRAALTQLQVRVAARRRRNEILNRAGLKQLDFTIGIGFYKGLASNEDTEIGPLTVLCEQLGEHFPLFQTQIDTGQVLTCIESAQGDDETPLFDIGQIGELFQFTAQVELTFRGARR